MLTAPPRTQIACVRQLPYALSLVQRQHPGVPVATLNERGTVQHASGEAQALGVLPGMRLHAATSRCPDLHAEVVAGPTIQAAWAETLDALYLHSPRVHGPTPGLAFLTLTEPAARELASAWPLPIGLAASQEVAHLAALRAKPGEMRTVPLTDEATFLSLTPLRHLGALGLTPRTLDRLSFLGLRGLADLMKWSAAQRQAYLGAENAPLKALLSGQRTTAVPLYRPGEVIEATLAFDAPLSEPGPADAALRDLLPAVHAQLRGRTAAYVRVSAETVGGQLAAVRQVKTELDLRALMRLARLALTDTGALPLGIDRLTVQLSGLVQPARQVGLWPSAVELDATRAVLGRYPDALVRVLWLDEHAYASDARYTWVHAVSGAARPLPTAPGPMPAPSRVATPARAQVGRPA